MALTLSGTNGVVGAGFTVDASGVSVTAGVGTFSSLNAAASGLTGALPALDAANLTSINAAQLVGVCTSGLTKTGGFGGITMAQQWRVTSDFTVSSVSDSVISSNWESADTHGYGTIGSNLTESSGVFSFPSTGIYRIGAKTTFNNTSSANYKTELKMHVQTASDSNWQMATGSGQSLSSPAEQTGSMSLEYLFDVTNTSSCIFRLLVFSHEGSIKFHGASDKTETGFTVIRLGDT